MPCRFLDTRQKMAMEVMGLACDLISKMQKAEWHWAHSAFI
jgi:hypothetical protein